MHSLSASRLDNLWWFVMMPWWSCLSTWQPRRGSLNWRSASIKATQGHTCLRAFSWLQIDVGGPRLYKRGCWMMWDRKQANKQQSSMVSGLVSVPVPTSWFQLLPHFSPRWKLNFKLRLALSPQVAFWAWRLSQQQTTNKTESTLVVSVWCLVCKLNACRIHVEITRFGGSRSPSLCSLLNYVVKVWLKCKDYA